MVCFEGAGAVIVGCVSAMECVVLGCVGCVLVSFIYTMSKCGKATVTHIARIEREGWGERCGEGDFLFTLYLRSSEVRSVSSAMDLTMQPLAEYRYVSCG